MTTRSRRGAQSYSGIFAGRSMIASRARQNARLWVTTMRPDVVFASTNPERRPPSAASSAINGFLERAATTVRGNSSAFAFSSSCYCPQRNCSIRQRVPCRADVHVLHRVFCPRKRSPRINRLRRPLLKNQEVEEIAIGAVSPRKDVMAFAK